MQQTEEQIWHCPSEPDRKLAELLVGRLDSVVWIKLALHFHKHYPNNLAEKYDLVYRLLGCKKD